MPFLNRPSRGAWLILLFASIEFLLRSPILLGARALYERDLFLLYFPLVQSALRVLSEGAWPLRDPTSGFGQPLLANPDAQILYPPGALHLFLPPHLAYAWFVSIHSVFGAMGVALLARRFAGGSWLAAVASGLFWITCGPLQSLANVWHHMAGASWIPWVLLGVVSATNATPWRSVIALGAAVGAQMLAGSADMVAMSSLLSLCFVVPWRLRLWRIWLGAAGVAVALSAGLWLPTMEVVLNSTRAALTAETRTGWSLHPLLMAEFFLPLRLASFPLLPEWSAVLFDGREPFLGSVFMGTLLAPLGLAALADARISRATRFALFCASAGAFLISMGKHTLVYSMAVTLIPPLRVFRFPSKAMVAVAVVLCVLAGVGASALRTSPRARRAALLGIAILGGFALTMMGPALQDVVTVLLDQKQTRAMAMVWSNLPAGLAVSVSLLTLLMVWVRWPSGRTGALLALALGAGHLAQSAHQHSGLHLTVPAATLDYKPPDLELFRPPQGGRVFAYDYGMVPGAVSKHLHRRDVWDLGAIRLPFEVATVVAGRSTLTPLTGSFWGLEYAWDGDFRLLFDRRLALLTDGLTGVEETPGFLKLLQISGVQRVVSMHEEGMYGLKLLFRRSVFQHEDLRVFEVPDARPRAYLTPGRRRGAGPDLADLLSAGFDPSTTVLVDGGPERREAPEFSGRALVSHRRADRLTVETTSNGPAFLTVIEGSLPGWRVWIDGKPGTVERANAIFIGTEVPSGAHRVEFRFLPTTAIVGFSLTTLTTLLLIGWFFHRRGAPEARADYFSPTPGFRIKD